jgi:flagellar basal-body rod protein FlgC
MDVTAENLANAQSTNYHRKEVVLAQGTFGDALDAASRGVEVTGVVQDASPGKRVYDPGNPAADAQGYVTMPNVDSVTEMVNLIDSSRSYEANVTAMQTAKTMFTRTLDILK